MGTITGRLKELTRPTGEEDLLAVSYDKPRMRFNRSQIVIFIGVVVAVAAIFLVRSLVSAPPQPVADFTQLGVSTVGESAVSGTESTAAPPTQCVVSVVGAVAIPGIYRLESSARVSDALAKAEPHGKVDFKDPKFRGINLAEKLYDGMQIRVPLPGEPVQLPVAGGTQGGAAAGGPVSINSATQEELEELSGVGEKTAAAIISHREASGGFTSIEQLMDVKGIGQGKFDALADQVVL